MRRKILWTTIGLTLVLWFGQAWAQTADADGTPSVEQHAGGTDGVAPTEVVAADVPPPQPDARADVDAAQTRRLLERDDWPVLVVTPADGRTHHGPTWLISKRPTADQMPRLEGRFDPPTLEASLEQADAAKHGPANLAAMGDEAARLIGSVVMLPVRILLTEPVWTTRTTP